MNEKRFATPWILAVVFTLATLIFVVTWTAGWGAGPDMNEARNRAAAVLQEDGRLLVSGGETGGAALATAEALDAIGFFTPVASMQTPRHGHAGIRLSDGRVLVAGGITTAGSVTNTAEVYDPVADAWTTVGAMAHERSGAAALLLPDGRVLVVGGENAGSAIAELEIFDPVTQTFSSSLTLMQEPRLDVAAALLPDGRVLISGGSDAGVSNTRTDLYDPVLDTLVQAQDLLTPRSGHTATPLLDGKILIAGGNDGVADLASAEIYDPFSGVFLPLAGSLADARRDHLALLLPHNGSVLILGGTGSGNDLLTVERFLPWTSTFVGAGSLSTARPGAAVSPTGVDGALLVLGGSDLSSTEIYNFSTLRTDLEDYRPGDTALISGAGFAPSTLLTVQVVQLAGTPGAGSSPWEVFTDGSGSFVTTWTVEPAVTSGATFRISAESDAEDRSETLFRSSQRIGYVTVGDQIGDAEYATPASLSFPITVGRGSGTHANGAFDAALSISSELPPGVVVAFDPAVLNFSPADTLQAATLTITTDPAAPAGSFTLSVLAQKTGGGQPDSAAQDGLLSISARSISVTAAADTREYDGSLLSQGVPTISAGSLAPGDTGSWSQTFDLDDAGARVLIVTPAGVSDNNGGGNYLVSYETAAGAITARPITVAAASDAKEYDGTTSSVGVPSLSAGSLAGTDVGLWLQSFDGDDAGARVLNVIPAEVADGNGGANYLVSYESSAGSISPRALLITATEESRTYDATSASTAQPTITTGALAPGDAAVWTQEFDSVAAGARVLNVVPGPVTDGNSGANYSLTYAPAPGLILPAGISLMAEADSREYDGTQLSSATPTVTGTLFGSDTIDGLQQAFDDRHAGERMLEVSGYTIHDGNGGANYAPNLVPAQGNISPAALELMAAPDNRIYDGTTGSSAVPTVNGTLFAADALTDLTQEFDSRHVGARTLAVSGYTLDDGNGGANYAVVLTDAAGAISALSITVTAASESRVYDSTTASVATPLVTDGALMGTDTAAWTQAFDGDDAGSRLLTVTPALVEDGNGGANYLVSYETAAGSITPAPLDILAVTDSRGYDGTILSTALPTSSPLGSDTVTGLEQAFDDKNAGPRTLAVKGYLINDGNGGANYTVSLVPVAGSIEPAVLELIAAPDSKPYDGTLVSGGVPTHSGTLFGSDSISGLEQEFDSRNAGDRNLTVTTYQINDGNGGANYAVQQAPATGVIAAAPLELVAAPDNRIYDGTTVSTVTPSYSGTLYGTDTLGSLQQEFDSRNVGTRTLSVAGNPINDGNGGANYALTYTTAAGSITPREIKVKPSVDIRNYDGTTHSSGSTYLNGGSLAPGDTGTWEQHFFVQHVGNPRWIGVTEADVNDGNGGANYVIIYEHAAGAINPAPLDIVAAADSRPYDGTDLSAALPTSSPLANDTVTGLAQKFDNPNAGSRSLVVTTYQVNDGNSGANYSVNLVPASGNIQPAILELIAAPDSKAYDGTPLSAGVPTYSGNLFGTDSISGLGQEFDSRNAGARSLTVTSYQINDGNGGANYAVQQLPAAGSIAAAPLELIAAPDSQIYDGTTLSSATPTYSGTLYGSDNVGNLQQDFDSRNVGARTLTVTGNPVNDGNGGANYALTFTPAAGSITPREITVKPSAEIRDYDGTANSSGSAELSGGSLAPGDTGTWQQHFFTKHAGNPRWIGVTEADVNDGNGGANYLIVYEQTAGVINPAPLDIVAAPDSRPYDATDLSAALPTCSPFGGDTVTGLAQKFDGPNAGPRSLLVTTHQINDGNGGANYVVNLVASPGTISPAVLDVYTTTDSKTYDGTLISAEVPTFTGSLYGSDTLTDLEQAFDSRDAGSRSLILSSYQVNDGVGGANYQVLTHSAAGSILPRTLNIEAAGIDKVFDNSTMAIVTLSDDRLAGDFFTINYVSANFARKMPGTWPVEVLGLSVSGTHAANYAPNDSAITAATISLAASSGSPRTPQLRLPYLSQLHLHGSLSEGSATMHHHTSEAIRTGYDLLWWSDHMERMMARMFVNHLDFEGTLTEEQSPGVNGSFQVDEPTPGFLALSFGSNAPASGAEHLTVGFDTEPGAAWTSARMIYEADRRIDHKSLMADPEVVIQVRPQTQSGDATFLVRLTLSARPDGTITGTPNVIEYVPAGMNAPDPAPNVRRLPIPTLTTGVWNAVTLRPALDAPPLFYEGLDQALYRVDLVFLSQNGGAMTVDLDAFNMELLGLTDLALAQAQSDMVESLYSANIHQEVGIEVAGPDAQGVPFNHNDHLIALYPNGVTSLIDFTEPGTDPDNYPQSAIDRLHGEGAVVGLAHIFGPGNGDEPISDEDAIRLAARIINARAWGCDAMEVGYPWRQKAIQYHVDVWDILSRDGVFITGTAVSDNHNVEYWDVRVNRWGSWLRSTGADAPSWLEAIRGGQVFFGDPNRFEANGDLVFEARNGNFSMGDVVPIQAGSVQFRAAVHGASAGDTLVVLLNGEFFSTHPLVSGALEVLPTVPVAPGDFVRVEMRDSLGQPYLFSNPIYFIPVGQQPPPHRAPGP